MGEVPGNTWKKSRGQELEAKILALAKGQHGHIGRRQLLALGLSRGAIEARLECGEYIAIHVGVYGIAPRRDDPVSRAAAAVLACGEGAVLSHASAASLWGFLPRWAFPLEVTASQRKRPGITAHRCRTLKHRDTTKHFDVPTTSPERTILDLAPRLSAKQLTRMVNDARRAGYVHLASLRDVVARNPYHPGSKRLALLANDQSNPTRSGFEDDFRLFAVKYGLPRPLINTYVNGYEVDAYFPDHGVIVELDGRDYHADSEAFEADRERDAEQLKHGVKTVRITTTRFAQTPDREANRLQEILDGQ